MLGGFLMTALMLAGIFLIFIVLIQRGRGGGLAGALGGAGGQSALGTRAGDVMTKVTCVVAVIWVLLAGFSGLALRSGSLSQAEEILDDSADVDKPATAISSGTKTEVDEKTSKAAKTESDDTDKKTIEKTEAKTDESKTEKTSTAEKSESSKPESKDSPDEKKADDSADEKAKPAPSSAD